MKKPSLKSIESYAAKPVLVFSGSLLVLSIALNNIGFKVVIDAWAQSIAQGIESNCKTENKEGLDLLTLKISSIEELNKAQSEQIDHLKEDSHKAAK